MIPIFDTGVLEFDYDSITGELREEMSKSPNSDVTMIRKKAYLPVIEVVDGKRNNVLEKFG